VTVSLNRVPRLDRDQVVRAALRLLDEAGLDGLTLRRLAAELDVKAPALYWHFANKQDLLDHMAHVMTQPWMHTISTTAAGRPWEDWLTEVARTYRTLLLSHRDGARLVASTRPLPQSLPLLDSCIAAFQQATGCGPGQALRCLTTLIAFVRGFVLDEEAELHRAQEQPQPQPHQPAKRPAPRTPQPVPHLDAAMHDIGSPNGEDTFEYGLQLIVDGIRTALHSHTTSGRAGGGQAAQPCVRTGGP
jgi:TetR/AcrR family transcriptional regulator, tetracycline repressor protein